MFLCKRCFITESIYLRAFIFIHCWKKKSPRFRHRYIFLLLSLLLCPCASIFIWSFKRIILLFSFEPIRCEIRTNFILAVLVCVLKCLLFVVRWVPVWCASIRANITRLLLICHLIATLTRCFTSLQLDQTRTETRAIITKW